MVARLVLAFVLVFPLSLATLVPALQAEQQLFLAIEMQTTAAGRLQIYFDTGAGFSEAQTVVLPLRPSVAPVEYRAPMPSMATRSIRIDPGEQEGRYVIRRVEIRTGNGGVLHPAPLDDIRPVNQLAEDARTTAELVLRAPPGAYDPQLLYEPTSKDFFAPAPVLGRALSWIALYVSLAVLCLWCIERALAGTSARWERRLASIGAQVRTNAGVAVFIAATLATIVDTYPLLFFGRSLVSPNNGGTLMLYDQAPFVPGSDDFDIEDVRGNDVGAMMWAFVPYSAVQRRALAEHEFPLWNRYNAGGRTLWGQGQSMLLDPLHWIPLLAPDLAAGWDLKFVAHRLIFAWGTGTAVLMATGNWFPSVLAAAAAPFLGLFAYRFNHPAAFAVTYLPWALAGWFIVAKARNRHGAARGSLLLLLGSSLMLLASPPKEAALLIVATGLAGSLAVAMHAASEGRLGTKLLIAATGGLGFLLLTAPHWLMFLRSLGQAQTASDTPAIQVASWDHLPAFFLGTLAPGGWFVSANMLVLACLLGLATAPQLLWRHRTLLATGVACALLLAVAFGIVPVSWMMRVPLLARIGHVYDVAITGAAALALVATAVGVEALARAGSMRAAFCSWLLAGGTAWMVWHSAGTLSAQRIEPWAIASVGSVAAALPVLLRAAQQQSPSVLSLGATGAAVLFVLAPGGLHLETGYLAVDRLLTQPRERVSLQGESSTIDAVHAATTRPTRAAGINLALFAGSQALYDIEGISGPDALWTPWFSALLDAAALPRSSVWLSIIPSADAVRVAPLLDLLNVGFLIGRVESLPPGPTLRTSGPDLVAAMPRPTAWPRAFFVDRVFTYTGVEDYYRRLGARQGFAAVETTDAWAMSAVDERVGSADTFVEATNYKLTTNTTRFTLRTPGPGVAVLSEAYVPDDLVVTVNGEPATYFRVNHAFRGVRIAAAGDWDVQFVYRPARWTLTLLLATGGLLLVLALLGTAIWSQRRSADGEAVGTR